MHHLVYWYGENDPAKSYDLVPPGNLQNFKKRNESFYAVLPSGIQRKLDKKLELSETERRHHRTQTELLGDLNVRPIERRTDRIPAFQELYNLISERDLEEFARCAAASESAFSNGAQRRKRDDHDDVGESRPRQKHRVSQYEPQVVDDIFDASSKCEESDSAVESEDGKPFAVYTEKETSISDTPPVSLDSRSRSSRRVEEAVAFGTLTLQRPTNDVSFSRLLLPHSDSRCHAGVDGTGG
jgi:hypothetical protein